MEGFIFFLMALVFLGFVFSIIGFLYWMMFTKNGKRYAAKDARKREIRRGLQDAETYEGVDEEAMSEEMARYERKKAKQRGR